MDPQTFWLYGLASACLVFGVLGLRFALSVLAANAVLAAIYFLLPEAQAGNNLSDALMIAYPLYWGAAFFLLRWVDGLPLPSPPLGARIAVGCLLCLLCVVLANKDFLVRQKNILYALYLAPVEERPALLKAEYDQSSYAEVCLDSDADIMRLAMGAKDHAVLRVMLEAYGRCYSASATASQVIAPLMDAGDLDGLDVLMAGGLKPSTLVSGSAYRGSALSYAATIAKNREIVRSLVRHDPDDARNLPFLSVIRETLQEQNNSAMLKLFRELGLEAR